MATFDIYSGSSFWVSGTEQRQGNSQVRAERPVLAVSYQRSVMRTLFLALGTRAENVTGRAEELSRHWLQTSPPLVRIDSPANATEDAIMESVSLAVRKLSSQELVAELSSGGYSIQRHDEIHVFLVVDVVAGDTPATTHADIAAALALLEVVAAKILQEVRAHTAVHVLMLAEPASQVLVAAWAKALRQGGVTDLWLAGPVDAQHQRLHESVWLARASRGLAALAWAEFPSHANVVDEDCVRVLGASGWDTTLPALRRWLAQRSALAGLRLLEAPQTTQVRDVVPALLSQKAEQLVQALEASVTRPLLLPAEAAIQPDWPQLAELAEQLGSAEKQADARHQLRVRQDRMRWLQVQRDQWQQWATAWRARGLLGSGSLPSPTLYAQTLAAAAAVMRARLETLDELLETATAEVERSEKMVARAYGALKEATAQFPAYTLKGLLALMVQPWRWPAWLWLYLRLLPQRCRSLVQAQAARREAVWHEANLHTLRQLSLAGQQDLQRLQSELVPILEAKENAVSALNEAVDAASAADRLQPWAATQAEGLWVQREESLVESRLAAWLKKLALPEWPPVSTLVDDLTTAMAEPAAPVAGWTSVDCLVEGLLAKEQVAGDALANQEPFLWLDEQYAAAVPLWPRPSLAHGALEQRWLLVPAQQDQARSAHSLESVPTQNLARLCSWAETQREPVAVCWLAGESVSVLCWMPIGVRDLEFEA